MFNVFKNNVVKIVGLLLFAALLLVLVFWGNSNKAGAGNSSLLQQFFIAGGWIVWFILLPMSLLTVYLAVEYALTLRKKILLPQDRFLELNLLLESGNAERIFSQLRANDDLLSSSVLQALKSDAADEQAVRRMLADSLEGKALVLFRKIEWLNLIGNVAPMVGLFGTIVGMIELFNTIVSQGGQPQPVHLAHGISVALVTTFWGLLIAIPALSIHGVFQNRIETLISEASIDAEKICSAVKSCIDNSIIDAGRIKSVPKIDSSTREVKDNKITASKQR